MLTALPDAINDLTLPCHEQRAGAATASVSTSPSPGSRPLIPSASASFHHHSRHRAPGASIPSEAMMHFPRVSDFPPIFEKFSDSEERFHNFTFS